MTLSQIAVNPLDKLGQYLNTAYQNFKLAAPLQYAEVAERYYNLENDIENTLIMYQNDEGDIVEDPNATNTKISHGFFPELVDQKVQYILGDCGIKVKPKDEDDSTLDEELEQYFGDDWQLAIQELIEGASIKGFEGFFARTTADDRLVFQVADALRLVPVYDDYGSLIRVLRYYTETRYSSEKQKTVFVQHCDVWDEQQVAYYIQVNEGESSTFELDRTRDINPAPHVLAWQQNPNGDPDEGDDWLPLGRSYESFPFYILNNNGKGTSDLKPIKDKIDDYDIMNCYMSNNLQDMTEAFYVVKGYNGESISKLRQNLKARKVVNLAPSPDAGVDIKTYDIPIEGRKVKMELDEVNIYRSGMGFNAQQLGDGNITNVVIKSRYTLLSMKASKLIARLKACLKWQAELVAADINRRTGSSYTSHDIDFEIEPSAIVNESDIVKDEYVREQTRALALQEVMQAAPRIGDEFTLRGICEVLDLDFEDVKAAIEKDEEESGQNVGQFDATAFLPQNNPQSAAKAAQALQDAPAHGVDPQDVAQ